MSWWVAGTAIAGAGAKFLGSQSAAKDMKEAARDSMLTARYNINQRKLEDRQTQFAILEQGHQAASNIQKSADQAVGTATVAAGGSGAIVESGTPRAVLTNIAQEGLHAQMGAILNTKNAIKAQARQTEAHNKTEWNQASAYSKGLSRDAKRTMDNARLNFAADTISAVAGGYASSLTAASTTDKVIKGAKTANTARHAFAQKPSHVPKGPTSNYSGMGKGSAGYTIGSTAKYGSKRKGFTQTPRSRSKAIHTGASGLPSKQGVGSLKKFFSTPYATGKWAGGKHGWKIKGSGLPWWHGRTMK